MLHDNNQHQLSVISVVEIGGVGKTTLAQCVYNNAELMKGFDLKAWICVSEDFDVVEITRNVIKEISQDTSCLENFNSPQLALKGLFTIFVTSRRENVGSIVQNYCPYFFNGLSDEYCWSVFADNASFPKTSNGSSELEEGIGKCDGLPLAAETLGRLLCTKHDVKEWNKILMSNLWGFFVTDSKIIPALFISYFHLPAYLKRCFVYCSLYPKGYQFNKDELILLWMAEDLLRPVKRGETLVEVGRECFDDLASKLFFKQLQDNERSFVMHDLLHDLAKFLAGDFYCC
ncbi:hypothetical protein PIB30_067515 [Stylosanthes scabra]|uniref:NB-ARC domain-containing protein n=1 Tax=Stylosanthes scabra TaxID=79078 RepID=A0ABU6VL13_9FABA|nr:hypothetical protein [Stylosanthes scabra]